MLRNNLKLPLPIRPICSTVYSITIQQYNAFIKYSLEVAS
nr:hypothetical protein [Tanacetum cinerariifolium]